MQPFDSIAVRAVVRELDGFLTGARLDKVQQPAQRELLLVFRRAGSHRVVISAQGAYSRIHLTARKAPPSRAGQAPPSFCLSLRKHLEGARLLAVEPMGLERAVVMRFEAMTESGLIVERKLVAELGGAHSNVILLDDLDVVMATLRPVTQEMSRVRQILPGAPYDPPPLDPGRRDPRGADVHAALGRAGRLDQALVKTFHSLSRVAIGQICRAAGLEPDGDPRALRADEIDRLQRRWDAAMEAIEQGRFEPRLEAGPSWDYDLLPSGSAPRAETTAVSELLDSYYGSRWEHDRLESRRSALLTEVDDRIARLEARVDHADRILSAAEEAASYRAWGDLLLAYSSQVPIGASEARLPDFETGIEVVVPLDPARSAVDNAQRHYRAFRKAQGARQEQARLRAEARFELSSWHEVREEIATAQGAEALERAAGPRLEPGPARRGALTVEGRPARYRSADGLEILVGRNNRQNDLVTFKLARPEDWWFHVQKGPGAHVVVRGPSGDRPVPERTAFQAALLAAWFSRSRTDTRVAVAFTRRKHVRKPSGAKPGFVMYDHERVVVVQPERAEVDAIAELE